MFSSHNPTQKKNQTKQILLQTKTHALLCIMRAKFVDKLTKHVFGSVSNDICVRVRARVCVYSSANEETIIKTNSNYCYRKGKREEIRNKETIAWLAWIMTARWLTKCRLVDRKDRIFCSVSSSKFGQVVLMFW